MKDDLRDGLLIISGIIISTGFFLGIIYETTLYPFLGLINMYFTLDIVSRYDEKKRKTNKSKQTKLEKKENE